MIACLELELSGSEWQLI